MSVTATRHPLWSRALRSGKKAGPGPGSVFLFARKSVGVGHVSCS